MTSFITSRVVDLGPDLPLTVRETGNGPTVLVLHGGGGPDSLNPIVDRFAPTHHVLAPTHPGWNGTPRPDRLNNVAALAATYLDLLDQLGLGGVTLLSSSFGGWVAAEMAIQDQRNRLSRLVLIDAVGPRPEPQHRPTPDPHAPPSPTSPGQSPQAFALLQAYTGPDMWDADLSQRLSQISIPTLVVWGEHDPVLTPAYGRAYAQAIPTARFTLIDAAGHLPTTEAPEPTFAAIEHFLTEQTDRTETAA